MIPPDGYDAAEAGRLVGKSASWMYKAGAAGKIPRCKLGLHVWWTDEQIAAIKRAAEQPAQPKQPEAKKTEQRQRRAPAKKKATPKRQQATGGAKNIPQADYSVSRLYRGDKA